MKTILLIIALTGFIAVGSYAQNKDCYCKHITVQKVVTQSVTQSSTPALYPLCFLTTVNNAGIEKCANATYDNTTGLLQYESEKPYVGYYPAIAKKTNKVEITKKTVW